MPVSKVTYCFINMHQEQLELSFTHNEIKKREKLPVATLEKLKPQTELTVYSFFMNILAVLAVVTFVDLLQTDDVSVVPGQLLLDQVLPVVQLQGVGCAVRVKHSFGQFCLCVDISEDVVGHHPHSRPLHLFHCINVSVVERAHAWSGLHGSHRHQLLGRTTTTPIFGCAAKFEPVANVLV